MMPPNLRSIRRQSTKSNKDFYFQKLNSSNQNKICLHLNDSLEKNVHLNRRYSTDTIRVVRGTTSKQGLHIPRFLLTSPTKTFQIERTTLKQKENDYDRPRSIQISSAKSQKSRSTMNKESSSLSEFNSSSCGRIKSSNDLKDKSFERRSSSGRSRSIKCDLISRPPSTPVEARCERAYSSATSSIDRETCALLGPQLCSDCIEIQTRNNLSPERLPTNLIRQRLSSLAIRPLIKNEEDLTDEDLFHLVNNQQIEMNQKTNHDSINSQILTDEEYFHRLSLSLNQYSSNDKQFYFKDLKDFAQKYQSNQYERLFLSETPSPISSNPIFNQSSFEKFDISKKYSFMKKASTIKPNLKTNSSAFISTKKAQQFYNQNRFLINYSPPLLLQTLQNNIRKQHSIHSNIHSKQNHSLINSNLSQRQTIQI